MGATLKLKSVNAGVIQSKAPLAVACFLGFLSWQALCLSY